MRGWLCQQVCDYPGAHMANCQGLELAIQWKKEAAEISARLNLCLDAVYLARPQEAYQTLAELEVRLQQNDFGFHGWRWRLRLLHIKGLALLSLEKPDAALALAEEGMQLARKTKATKYSALNHELTGLAQSALGDMDAAIAHLKEALTLADRMTYQPLRWQARHRLAALCAACGEDARAAVVAEQARQIVNEVAEKLADPSRRRIFLDAVAATPSTF
jgi:tetratricopeptide (TPR) repeat protein